jgi:hypothetical protein
MFKYNSGKFDYVIILEIQNWERDCYRYSQWKYQPSIYGQGWELYDYLMRKEVKKLIKSKFNKGLKSEKLGSVR